MPPRLNKRQQRELEELQALRGSSTSRGLAEEAPGNEDGVLPVQRTMGSAFAALIDDNEQSSNGEDETLKLPTKKAKKKKKKGAVTSDGKTLQKPASSTGPTTPPGSAKKSAKKAKAKEKKDAKDELDQVLSEMSIKYPELQSIQNVPHSSKAPAISFASLLSISLAHLDSEAEMKKFFGAKVVQATRSSASGPSAAATRRIQSVMRSNLTHPQPTWWSARLREGLSICPLSDSELLDRAQRHGTPLETQEKWWTVDYSKKYKSMTWAFMRTVMSGDPEGFWNLLNRLPWHADTLLQLAEVYRHREEYAQAVDFVDRALFTYERSFIGAFTFTSGLNRLDFDRVENRPFFLAIHRQMADLQRRGCVRTAFEFARLLYSLDPWDDPHGALLHLDFLAIKGGMSQWLLDIYDLFVERQKGDNTIELRSDPSVLPGWNYARALALHIAEISRKEAHETSSSALREAIRSFPSVVSLLADKLDMALPSSIRAHKDFRVESSATSLSPSVAVLHLLSHLYVQRSVSLWKDPRYIEWFKTVVTSEFQSLPSSLPKTKSQQRFLHLYNNGNLRHSVYRHVLVLESRQLFPFLPREVTNVKSLACDPLPPLTAVSEYNEDFFRGTEDLFSQRSRTRRERVADERRLERLIPDAAFRRQLQEIFEAQPIFAERFPGGVIQFAQAMAQMPEEVLEDMMLAAAMNDQNHMPGEMPDFAELAADMAGDPGAVAPAPEVATAAIDDDGGGDPEDEDEDEEDEAIAPMPVRFIRNLMNRLWGGDTGDAEEDSSSDDNTLVIDVNDVD